MYGSSNTINSFTWIKNNILLITNIILIFSIINFSLGYSLSKSTKFLIVSQDLPKDIWYWIVFKCYVLGIIIPVAIGWSAYSILYQIIILIRYLCSKKLNRTTSLFIYTKLKKYLFADFSPNEMLIIYHLYKHEKNLETISILDRLLNRGIVYKHEVDIILNKNFVKAGLKNKRIKNLTKRFITKLEMLKEINLGKSNLKQFKCFSLQENAYIFRNCIQETLIKKDFDHNCKLLHSLLLDKFFIYECKSPFETFLEAIGFTNLNKVSQYIISAEALIIAAAFYFLNPQGFMDQFSLSEYLTFGIVLLCRAIASYEKFENLNNFLVKFIFYSLFIFTIIGASINNLAPQIILNSLNDINKLIILKEKNINIFLNSQGITQMGHFLHFKLTNCQSKKEQLCYDLTSDKKYKLKHFNAIYNLDTKKGTEYYIFLPNGQKGSQKILLNNCKDLLIISNLK